MFGFTNRGNLSKAPRRTSAWSGLACWPLFLVAWASRSSATLAFTASYRCMKQSRPIAIIITQILMAFSLVPLGLGFVFFLLRTLIMDPTSLLTVRALLFVIISLPLITTFLIYGFGGLWKRKIYGYWLGLLFLAAVNLKNVYTVGLTLRRFLAATSYNGLVVLDVSLQCIIALLILLLFLKVCFGKKEKAFFRSVLDTQ